MAMQATSAYFILLDRNTRLPWGRDFCDSTMALIHRCLSGWMCIPGQTTAHQNVQSSRRTSSSEKSGEQNVKCPSAVSTTQLPYLVMHDCRARCPCSNNNAFVVRHLCLSFVDLSHNSDRFVGWTYPRSWNNFYKVCLNSTNKWAMIKLPWRLLANLKMAIAFLCNLLSNAFFSSFFFSFSSREFINVLLAFYLDLFKCYRLPYYSGNTHLVL